MIAKSYLPHVVEKREQAREQFANYILPTLTDPLEVWLTQYDDGSFRRRFIKAFDKDGKQSLVVGRENKDGSIFYNFIPDSLYEKRKSRVTKRKNYLDNQRTGFLLYRKEK